MPRMSEIELLNIVSSEISASTSFLSTEISDEREKALEYYRGDPFGDERDGHSQVVSKDVMDTIEWILPNLVSMFLGTRRVVEFCPNGPEDIALSRQQTDYVNYVIRNQNPGFMILYTMLKDALIQKIGVVKHYWAKPTRTDTVEYEGLTEDELAFVISEEERRADSVTVVEQNQEGRRGGFRQDPFTRAPIPFVQDTFSVKLRRVYEEKRVFIENVPPEEFLISRRAKSMADATFVAHRIEKTYSDLIAEGFPRSLVETLPTTNDDDMSGEKETRHEDEDDITPVTEKKVMVTECYIKVDFDDDGIAELRQVVLAGNQILSNEEIDCLPFSAWTPIPMPHRSEVAGMSVAETIMDLQLIKSTLLRGMLDNLYLTNTPEMEVVWDQVNHKDALTRRPGGIKRVNQPGMYNPLNVPFIAGQSFPMLEYLEAKQAGRTGVSATSTGIDPDILKSHQTKGAIDRVMTSAQQRIELIARVFAETGLRSLMCNVLKLVTKHQDKEAVVRLRGEWVPIDPREWNAEKDVMVETGLGTGDQDRRMLTLQQTLGYQIQAWQDKTLGMVRPKHMYNTIQKMLELSDEPGIEPFFDDPESEQGENNRQAALALMQGAQEGQQTGSDGEAFIAGEQIKARTDLLEAQMKNALKVLELRQKDDLERDKLETDAVLKAAELLGKYGAQVDMAQIRANMERERNFLNRPPNGSA